MTISRLAIRNPAADTPSVALDSTGTYVLSVIVSNISDTLETKVDIWIAPTDSEDEEDWGYIAKNAPIDAGNALETFRFSLIPEDVLYVKSNNGFASFTLVGISQSV